MPDVLVARDPIFLEHRPHPGHPEREARLEALMDLPILAELGDIPVRAAEPEELARVHDRAYIEQVRRTVEAGGAHLDPDTAVGPGSWRAALCAAGASIDLCEQLLDGRARAAMGLVRPPGHHATSSRAMGFCIFNNAAVAAQLATEKGKRVAVVDWDVHHGNGTEAIFYGRDDVLFVSMHQYPYYPGTGAMEDLGEGPGRGFTRNIPLGPGCRDADYMHVIDEVVCPRLDEYAPDLLVISAGYDGHRSDPLAGMILESSAYPQMALRLMHAAPHAPLLVLIEGGYDLNALRESVDLTLRALLDPDQELESPGSPSPAVARQVQRVQSTWEGLGCP